MSIDRLMPKGLGLSAAKHPHTVVLLLLVLGASYWLWIGMSQRSFAVDDGISIMASQGIVENGYPLLPSGYVYTRGYVPHYLVAAAIGLFGLNDFSVILPALLMAVGSLWLVYLFAKDILGRPWVGIGAVMLLLALQIEAYYATSPRMYMALQLFTMLAVYGAWRGYIRGEVRFRLLTVFAIAAAMLTHELGGALVVALPVSTLVVAWLRDRRPPAVYLFRDAGGAILVGVTAFFVYLHDVPGRMPSVTAWAGQDIGTTGLNMDVSSWTKNLFDLELAFPFALAFLLVPIFVAAARIRSRGPVRYDGATYALLVFAVCALVAVIATTLHAQRFWLFVLPLYALLATWALAEILGNAVVSRRGRQGEVISRAKVVLPLLLVLGVTVNLGYVAMAEKTTYSSLAAGAYGTPCDAESSCRKSARDHYAVISKLIGTGDVIVSSNPMTTRYYLGRVDAYLRERIDDENGQYTAFTEPIDEYHGVPLIDTVDELGDLLLQDRPVWIIADRNVEWAVGPNTRDFLARSYQVFYSDGIMTTYGQCDVPRC